MKIIPTPTKVEFKNQFVEALPKEVTKINNELENEEYILSIDNDSISLEGGSERAVFYAKQTLKQLDNEYDRLPICKIYDKPKYAYRAFMIDSARHMQEISEIKEIIDAMSLLKYNTFHWHLTEDQGWRFESENYPLLNTKAAVRPYSDFGKTYDGKPYGRVYTKDEMREIVSYCAERYIDVIPEFDMPGHTSALLSVFPELSCKGDDIQIKTHQGIYSNVLCPAKDKTYEVVEKLIDEFCEIFPYKYFHIGGDETPSKQWEDCPECQYLKTACNLKSWAEYQNYYMNTIIDYLDKKGKTAIVWNDAAKGSNLDKRAVLQYWKEVPKNTVDYANTGGKVILSPFSYFYFDYYYEITSLRRVLSYKPKFKDMSEKGYENLLGIEAPIWTEYIRDKDKMQRFLFPRAIAAAQVAWGERGISYDRFVDEMQNAEKLIRDKGIAFEDKKEWGYKRISTPHGWIRFSHDHFGKKKDN